MPIGVAGEIYVGGAGLAREYLNRPELTAERFIIHPYSNRLDEKLYKTGDLARYLVDGSLEYLGRIDHQVKIRGFRIELGEVNSVLLSHPLIEDATVIAKDDGKCSKKLVAFLVVAEKIEQIHS